MTSFSITLEEELKRQLEDKAKELKIDAEELVIKAIKDFFYLEKVNNIRKRLSKKIQDQGFNKDEDIFNEVS